MLRKHRIGFITQGTEMVASLYAIPASAQSAKKCGIISNLKQKPVWLVREYSDHMEVWYESIADGFRYPIMKKAKGEMYNAALKEIKKYGQEDVA